MSNNIHILVVDDEPDIRESFQEYLEINGYRVSCADGAAEARRLVGEHDIDVALLDISMPGEDGLSLARYLREHTDLAIIMVASAGDVMDRVIGIEVGADDYLAKPVDLRELVARVTAVLRWKHAAPGNTSAPTDADDGAMILFGRCRLDMESHRLLDGDGKSVSITEMDFKVLKLFAENPRRTLSRAQILQTTRGRDWDPADRSVDIQMGRIRRKIEPDPKKPTIIKTVHSRGYVYMPTDDQE
jgi:two-component system phosphate regulon response regulator OmpR